MGITHVNLSSTRQFEHLRIGPPLYRETLISFFRLDFEVHGIKYILVGWLFLEDLTQFIVVFIIFSTADNCFGLLVLTSTVREARNLWKIDESSLLFQTGFCGPWNWDWMIGEHNLSAGSFFFSRLFSRELQTCFVFLGQSWSAKFPPPHTERYFLESCQGQTKFGL